LNFMLDTAGTGPAEVKLFFVGLWISLLLTWKRMYSILVNMMSELEQLKEDICMKSFGRSRNLSLAAGQCVKCGTYDLDFRDEPSQREYKLTVWCQSCQDDFFGVEED